MERNDPASLCHETLILREQGRRSLLEMTKLYYAYCLERLDEVTGPGGTDWRKEALDWLHEAEGLMKPWVVKREIEDTRTKEQKLIDYAMKALDEHNKSKAK